MTKTISMKELRENFPEIRDGLKSGITYTLIYHSKPLAELKPSKGINTNKIKKTYNSGLALFANPPKELLFKSKKNAVQIIREDRK